MKRRGIRKVAAGLSVGALVAMTVSPASAATTSSWASWTDLEGESRDYTASMTLAGQPLLTADITSDSRAGGVGLISGSSTWLSEGTPAGAKYGSSRNQPYFNLRPYADSASSPSTTTYTFDSPTPTSGWAFVLGDIDADQVSIKATTADGSPATAEDLGFQSGFNYCAEGVTGKPSCTGDADDIPGWDDSTLTLTGNDGAADTSGSTAWFEPTVPLSSLTFEYTQRSGFPIYQTWFVSQARDITGTVIDEAEGPAGGVEVTLTDDGGNVLATTTTAADGSYEFPEWFATEGYEVSFIVPDGKVVVGDGSQSVDLSEEDGVADFVVRDEPGEDPDADTDAEADIDADSVSDATSDVDAGTDPDAAADEDAGTDPDAEATADVDALADPEADTAADEDAGITSDVDNTADVDAGTDPDAAADEDAGTDPDAIADDDAEADSNETSDPNADTTADDNAAIDPAADTDSTGDDAGASKDPDAGTSSDADTTGGDNAGTGSEADSGADSVDAAASEDGGASDVGAGPDNGAGSHAGGGDGSDADADSADGKRLPVTGSTALGYSVGLGAFLIAAGIGLTLIVRRRRG